MSLCLEGLHLEMGADELFLKIVRHGPLRGLPGVVRRVGVAVVGTGK